MEPRMLVMQHSYFHNSIVGIRNDRSLVLVGTEYGVDFDLKINHLYIEWSKLSNTLEVLS